MTTLEDIPRLTKDKLQSLQDAGYTSLELLAVAKPEDLTKVGFGEQGASSAINFARDSTGIGGFVSGTIVAQRRAERLRYLDMGSDALNKLFISQEDADAGLRGGVEAGCIVEFFGEWGSTKTQIAHQLAVNVQLPKEQGGFGQKAIYIDTEGTFRDNRIRSMAVQVGLNPDEAVANIFVCQATNTSLQMDAIKRAIKFAQDNNVGAIIVDSLTSSFRSEWSGRGELADRQQTLLEHMHDLEVTGRALNCVIFVTNQVMKDPGALPGTDPTRSVGGDIVGHTSRFRVYLRKPIGKKAEQGIRFARMIDAPDLPVREAAFMVNGAGVCDIKE